MPLPKVIYLQIGEDVFPDEIDDIDWRRDEITWCIDRIHNSDIEYHLATPLPNTESGAGDD